MARVVITGASGFTGRYLAPLLSIRGYEVHGLNHDISDGLVAGLAFMHACDLTDKDRLNAVIRHIEPDHVIHLAAIANVAHADVDSMYITNILGTRNLLESCAALPIPLRSLLMVSSANIYGNKREGALDENTPIMPANDYGVTKASAELLVPLYADRVPTIIVRPFNYTGVGQSDSFLIPKIVRHVRQRASRISLGNIDVARDFSDVRAVVDAYVRLIEAPAAIGRVFNVCSGRAITLHEIIESASAIAGHEIAIEIDSALVRQNEIKLLKGRPDRIEAIIGPIGNPFFEDTLRWMLEA